MLLKKAHNINLSLNQHQRNKIYVKDEFKDQKKDTTDIKRLDLLNLLLHRLQDLDNAFLIISGIDVFKHLTVFRPSNFPHHLVGIMYTDSSSMKLKAYPKN